MTQEAMSCAIERLRANSSGLERYDRLQRSLNRFDVTRDRCFQLDFKGFYRVRRGKKWCELFFSILEREKRRPSPSFRKFLAEIHCRTGWVEASFTSKLVATIDASLPVWDSHVLCNLGLKPPYRSKDARRRLDRCGEVYSKIRRWASNETQQDSFKEWRRRFDTEFPHFTHFTDIKKLDLLLWQSR